MRYLHVLQPSLCPAPLHLVAVVLEPDLHLGGGQAEEPGQLLPLRAGQVALLTEAPLQLQGLGLGEQDAALLALLALVGLRVQGRVIRLGGVGGGLETPFIRSCRNNNAG